MVSLDSRVLGYTDSWWPGSLFFLKTWTYSPNLKVKKKEDKIFFFQEVPSLNIFRCSL